MCLWSWRTTVSVWFKLMVGMWVPGRWKAVSIVDMCWRNNHCSSSLSPISGQSLRVWSFHRRTRSIEPVLGLAWDVPLRLRLPTSLEILRCLLTWEPLSIGDDGNNGFWGMRHDLEALWD